MCAPSSAPGWEGQEMCTVRTAKTTLKSPCEMRSADYQQVSVNCLGGLAHVQCEAMPGQTEAEGSVRRDFQLPSCHFGQFVSLLVRDIKAFFFPLEWYFSSSASATSVSKSH